ncbi:hypothetical protein K437DRAFT_62260 [Tilletiaria anomala UBC 951]|uniref:Uncharacterized protein n=1 Tax=Tilletiaria anomala (strain ATCC 24038 / CBS 436.72 / UBC 951) TaxID=1037660 RepID=A0A066WJR2_TILAU|nr:uncharacterized protein K437DRAFT_62260 [Tilletiaria anomala UBC 951]KDN50870.1 hypothetical protein K437DRAFT_62260 [Tilletiaria anomala UBC 951]
MPLHSSRPPPRTVRMAKLCVTLAGCRFPLHTKSGSFGLSVEGWALSGPPLRTHVDGDIPDRNVCVKAQRIEAKERRALPNGVSGFHRGTRGFAQQCCYSLRLPRFNLCKLMPAH